MIQLASQRYMVSTANGCQEAVDVEEIRQQLLASFQIVGFPEPSFAEHLLEVLQHELARHQAMGVATETADGIDELVTRMLVNAGFGDVAAEYGRRRQLDMSSWAVGERCQWDHSSIVRLVQNSFPCSEASAVLLARAVEQQLGLLQIASFSEDLVRILAAHLLADTRHSPEQAPTAPTAPTAPDNGLWLFAADHWQQTLPEPGAQLLRNAIIEPALISRLYPRLQLTICLCRLPQWLQWTPPLTELEFFPALTAALKTMAAVVNSMHAQLCRSIAVGKPEQAHLLIQGLKPFCSHCFGNMTRSSAAALEHEVATLITADLGKHLDFAARLNLT